MKRPLVIAHRGASALVKFENTLEAFQKAIDIQTPMMEFDIRRTKDKRLISFHDDNVNGIKLSSITYSELLEITEKIGYKVPLVVDILELSKGKIRLDIEIKESGYEKEIVDLVNEYLDYEDYVIKSFIDDSVKIIKKYDKKVVTGLLLGVGDGGNIIKTRLQEIFPIIRLNKTNVDFVSPNYKLLNFLFILQMKIANKPIYVWTVNESDLMIKVINKNVDAIITDRPDIAMELINNYNK